MQLAQINVHHCRAATAALTQLVNNERVDVVLIQEPWLTYGKVGGLEAAGKIWSVAATEHLRGSILTRSGLAVTFLPQLSDNRTAAICVEAGNGAAPRRYVLVSLYAQWNDDEHPLGEKGEEIADWCPDKGAELLIGMDANTQHEVWG